ncbi:SS18-like protein 2 [Acipenser oxyrinchus oxyrinchus]|uniref:SS18-like protein 2 n=1 Tax=Acipenser oxyrinchus oxyrinchus TaxID=40147 RepID=A0AAD8G3W4_ACIOX|nr:SS18-like protein 2 [Acipenser oxyrinchus oxyrinchus]
MITALSCTSWVFNKPLFLFTRYQQILHRNLVYLATIADTSPNILPAAPTIPAENMGVCAAAQVQREESKSLGPPAGKENTDTWGGTQ